jgi:hypothetical protein
MNSCPEHEGRKETRRVIAPQFRVPRVRIPGLGVRRSALFVADSPVAGGHRPADDAQDAVPGPDR